MVPGEIRALHDLLQVLRACSAKLWGEPLLSPTYTMHFILYAVMYANGSDLVLFNMLALAFVAWLNSALGILIGSDHT